MVLFKNARICFVMVMFKCKDMFCNSFNLRCGTIGKHYTPSPEVILAQLSRAIRAYIYCGR